jgi:proteasome assembly chaperone (PAC2) family protein
MDELIHLDVKPSAADIYMIAGWEQWADAGAVSSELPRYLINQTGAKRIGRVDSDPFYLFQIPGTHGFLRPEIKMQEGYRVALTTHKNEVYYSGDEQRGLVIFTGEEPHVNAERYAEAFFNVAKELGVKRVAALGGVYGAMPYDKDREVSCSYSLPKMKEELKEYAVRFSNYEGSVSLGSYLTDHAEKVGMEYFTFYAFVPAYDFTHLSQQLQGMRIENDFRAWYELMRRFNHMFHLGIDLSDLERQSESLTASVVTKLNELQDKLPQVNVKAYIESLAANFDETPFMPLDVWERGLGDLFDDKE